MRTIPASTLQAMFALEGTEYPIILITIERSGTNNLYLSSDPTERLIEDTEYIWYGTTSNAQEFLHYPFALTLPSDTESAVPRMRISIDNVSPEIGHWFRQSTNIGDVTVDIVSSGDLDTPIATFPDFELRGFQGDVFQIEGTFILNTMVNEGYPAGRFTPTDFPGVF